MLPACHNVFQEYVDLLLSGQANLQDLVSTKRASKDSDEYEGRDTVEGSLVGC
jgi:hypothetical protein